MKNIKNLIRITTVLFFFMLTSTVLDAQTLTCAFPMDNNPGYENNTTTYQWSGFAVDGTPISASELRFTGSGLQSTGEYRYSDVPLTEQWVVWTVRVDTNTSIVYTDSVYVYNTPGKPTNLNIASSSICPGGSYNLSVDAISDVNEYIWGSTDPTVVTSFSGSGQNVAANIAATVNDPWTGQIWVVGKRTTLAGDAYGDTAFVDVSRVALPTQPTSIVIEGDTEYCSGETGTINLSVVGGSGSDVVWRINSVEVINGLTYALDKSLYTSDILVEATWENSCGERSNFLNRTITVTPQPVQVTNVIDVNGGTANYGETVQVDWDVVADATHYDMTINHASGSELIEDIPTNTYNVQFLESWGANPSIQVRAANTCFDGAYSAAHSVSISYVDDVSLVTDPSITMCSGDQIALRIQTDGVHIHEWSIDGEVNSGAFGNPTADETTFTYENDQTVDKNLKIVCKTTHTVNNTVEADTTYILVRAKPQIGNMPGSVYLCNERSYQFTPVITNKTPTYTWSGYSFDDPNIQNPTALFEHDFATEQSYPITLTMDYDECFMDTTVTVYVAPKVSLNAAPDVTSCGNGTTIGLSPIPGVDYHWNVNNDLGLDSYTSSNPRVNDTINSSDSNWSTEYIYRISRDYSNGRTCYSEYDNIQYTVYPEITLSFNTQEEATCQGTSVQIEDLSTDTANHSYVWSPAFGLDDTGVRNPIATPSSTTVYSVIKTSDITGCTNMSLKSVNDDTVRIQVNPAPSTVTLNYGGSACDPDSLYLGSHEADVTYYLDKKYIQNNWDFKNGDGSSYLTFDKEPESGLTYVVRGDRDGCVVRLDSITIEPTTFSSATQLVLNGPTNLCFGDSISFTVNNTEDGMDYHLVNGSDTLSSIIGATAGNLTFPDYIKIGGSFIAVVYDPSSACSNNITNTYNITVRGNPFVDFTVSDADGTICPTGDSLVIDPQVQTDWTNWGVIFDGNDQGQDTVIKYNVAGDYEFSVWAENQYGCTGSKSETVTVDEIPTQPQLSYNANPCEGYTYVTVLNARSDWDYVLEDTLGNQDSYLPSNVSGEQTFPMQVTTDFVLRVYNANQCSNSWIYTVTPRPAPTTIVNADTLNQCNDGYVVAQVTVNSDQTFNWYTNDPNIEITNPDYYITNITATESGWVYVDVQNLYSCVSTDSIYINVYPAMNDYTLNYPQPAEDCNAVQFTWTSHSGEIMYVNGDAVIGSMYSATTTDDYTFVVVHDVTGCTDTLETVNVTIVGQPTATFQGNNQTVCSGSPATIVVDSDAINIVVIDAANDTVSTSRVFEVTETNNTDLPMTFSYNVRGTNRLGCWYDLGSVNLIVDPVADSASVDKTQACEYDVINILYDNVNDSLVDVLVDGTSMGAVTEISGLSEGSHNITMITAMIGYESCETSNTQSVEIVSAPTVDVPTSLVYNQTQNGVFITLYVFHLNEYVLLDANYNGLDTIRNVSGEQNFIQVTEGTYHVEVTSSVTGCSSISDEIVVEQQTVPAIAEGNITIEQDSIENYKLSITSDFPYSDVLYTVTITAQGFNPFTETTEGYLDFYKEFEVNIEYIVTVKAKSWVGGLVDSVLVVDTVIVTDVGTTSISDLLDKQVKVYPNPCEGQFNLEGMIINSTYRIYNNVGVMVGIGEIRSDRETVNIYDLPTGIYQIVLISPDETGVVQRKLIKQ